MRRFCFTCKRHIDAADEQAFRRVGHDDRKVRTLTRGTIGNRKTAMQLASEHEAAEKEKAAKKIEEVVHDGE